MMADTVEALMGAAFEDGGEEALAKVIAALGLDHEYLRSVTFILLSPPSQLRLLHSLTANLNLDHYAGA